MHQSYSIMLTESGVYVHTRPSRSVSIFYVYVYGEYQDNDGVHESALRGDENANEALYHPKGNRGYADGAHHDNVNGYGIKIRGYEYGHDSQ